MTSTIYSRTFDASNKHWVPQVEHNLIFLKVQNNWADDLLNARGHIFLNEVYDMLGLARSKQGAIVGWFKTEGSNPVDFGISENEDGSIFLDFNVDGVIYDKLP